MNHCFTLNYKNVNIRPLEKKDLEALRIWRNDTENSRYLSKIHKISVKQQAEWFERYLDNSREIIFAIEETKELKRLVGSVSLYNIDEKRAEFGRFLVGDKEAHGKKVGFNTTKAVLEIGFLNLGLQEIFLKCYKDYKVACHIYEMAGFCVKELRETEHGIELYMNITRVQYEVKAQEEA